jgi:hypothetical protein
MQARMRAVRWQCRPMLFGSEVHACGQRVSSAPTKPMMTEMPLTPMLVRGSDLLSDIHHVGRHRPESTCRQFGHAEVTAANTPSEQPVQLGRKTYTLTIVTKLKELSKSWVIYIGIEYSKRIQASLRGSFLPGRSAVVSDGPFLGTAADDRRRLLWWGREGEPIVMDGEFSADGGASSGSGMSLSYLAKSWMRWVWTSRCSVGEEDSAWRKAIPYSRRLQTKRLCRSLLSRKVSLVRRCSVHDGPCMPEQLWFPSLLLPSPPS